MDDLFVLSFVQGKDIHQYFGTNSDELDRAEDIFFLWVDDLISEGDIETLDDFRNLVYHKAYFYNRPYSFIIYNSDEQRWIDKTEIIDNKIKTLITINNH